MARAHRSRRTDDPDSPQSKLKRCNDDDSPDPNHPPRIQLTASVADGAQETRQSCRSLSDEKAHHVFQVTTRTAIATQVDRP